MGAPGWLNDNLNRAYPFLAGTAGADAPGELRGLPDSAVAECGFTAGPLSGFDPQAHSVRLARVSRSGGTVTFAFASDAPGLAGRDLAFTRSLSDPDYLTSDADGDPYGPDAGSASDPVSAEAGGCSLPSWWGFLTTGRLADLAAWLPDGATVTGAAGVAVVEPALVQSLAGAWVHGVSLANAERTRATPPEGCPGDGWPYDPGAVHVWRACLAGPLRFEAGYNATVAVDAAANRVTLGARAGAGAGEPCGEVPLNPPERAYIRGPFYGRQGSPLSGGPWCGSAVRSVNGVPGPDVAVRGGPGVAVTPDPAGHRLVVDANMSGLAACFSDYLRVSESL